MKNIFKITDKKLIAEILDDAEYGVLALCSKKPYAVPVNFVYLGGAIYFHGSSKGKKMSILRENLNVSFNVNTDIRIIPSYFSSTGDLACPASTFFKSVIIDGKAEIIKTRDEFVEIFTAMMQKFQPEGKYKGFNSTDYNKQFRALSIVKINVTQISAKFKFGQTLDQKRFQMVIDHLENSGRSVDISTVNSMKRFYSKRD